MSACFKSQYMCNRRGRRRPEAGCDDFKMILRSANAAQREMRLRKTLTSQAEIPVRVSPVQFDSEHLLLQLSECLI